jgi:hypothetical protein
MRTAHTARGSDIAFFTQFVWPAVEEFNQKPGDMRLATQACQWLKNMSDHYFRHNQSDPAKVDNCTTREKFAHALRAQDKAVDHVMAIANGTKHARKRFDDLHHAVPGAFGIMRCGFPISPENYVFMDDDNTWPLYQLTEHVANVWKARLGLMPSQMKA